MGLYNKQCFIVKRRDFLWIDGFNEFAVMNGSLCSIFLSPHPHPTHPFCLGGGGGGLDGREDTRAWIVQTVHQS